MIKSPRRRARLVFIALLHDIGKPETYSEKDGEVHFYGHDEAGARIAHSICRRLKVSNADTRAVAGVINRHLRPLHLLNLTKKGGISKKAMIKFFDDAGDFVIEILALAMADKAAAQGPAADPNVLGNLQELCRTLLSFYREHYLPAIEKPFLTGDDLTEQLNLEPGQRIGRLLRHARDLQIRGELTSRDDALQWVARSGIE